MKTKKIWPPTFQTLQVVTAAVAKLGPPTQFLDPLLSLLISLILDHKTSVQWIKTRLYLFLDLNLFNFVSE